MWKARLVPHLLDEIGRRLLAAVPSGRRALVAVDGADGSGKTTFASGLASAIHNRPVVVLHADDYLNPSSMRHARGRHSPEGFWLDSYNYDALRSYALHPLGADGGGWYRPASYDSTRDATIRPEVVRVDRDTIVLVEGIFLHRDELVSLWDYSIYLHAPFTETARRMAVRDGSNPDPEHPSIRRYVDGQRLYFAQAAPWRRASLVVNNTSFNHPMVMDPAEIDDGP
jgi:uridine kinase